MKLVIQEFFSKNCGQCCVAMITGEPLDKVTGIIGHNKATTTKELVIALKTLGFTCNERLRRISKKFLVPELGICKIIKCGVSNWHWIVVNKDMVYDPSLDNPVLAAHYQISSALRVKKK